MMGKAATTVLDNTRAGEQHAVFPQQLQRAHLHSRQTSSYCTFEDK